MIPAPPAGAAPGDPGDPVDCERTTEALHAQHLYAEAANHALKCWDGNRDPLFLFRATKYWKRAGRHARAIHALRAYIQAGSADNPKRQSDAKADLQAEQDFIGRVLLAVTPALAPGERVTITAAPRSDPADTSPLKYTFSAGDLVELELDPGAWDLSVARDNYEAKTETVTVPPDRSAQSVNLAMTTNAPPPETTTPPEKKSDTTTTTPSPPPPSHLNDRTPRPRTALKLGGGIAVGGGSLVLLLAIGYAASVSRAERRYIEICEEQQDEASCYESYRYGKGLNVIQSVGFTTGALLLGAGIAMLAISARRKPRAAQGLSLFHMRGGLGVSLERQF